MSFVLFACVGFTFSANGESLKLVRTFRAGQGQVKSLTFTSDNRYLIWNTGSSLHRHLISTGNQETQRCQQLIDRLDAESFEDRQAAHIELQQHGQEIEPILRACLKDASRSREARQRSLVLLQSIMTPFGNGHQGEVRAIAPGQNERALVASAGRGGNVLLWQPNLGAPLRKLKAHEDGAWAVAFAPDQKELASGGGDNALRIWNLEDGANRLTLTGHENSIHDLAYSPDGTLLASAGSFDKTVRIWDPKQGKSIKVLHRESEPMCVSFHPDGQQLAAAGYGSTLTVWDTKTWSATKTDLSIKGVRCLRYSPDGRWLAAGGDGEELFLIPADSTSRDQIVAGGHRRGVLAMAFLGDGKTLATGDAGGAVRLWEFEN